MAEKKSNIIKFPEAPKKHFGFIIIALIGIYILYELFSYMFTGNVTAYEVTKGVIATNNNYKGLIIRDETVIYAPYTGKINYYVKAGTKVAANDKVYSIDTNGSIAQQINAATESSKSLDSSELSSLLDSINGFVGAYNNNDFYNVYSFKQDFASNLSQSLASNALADLSATISAAAADKSFNLESTGNDGVIAYYVDGMESITTSDFTADDLSSAGYSRNSLQQNTEISQGDPVCKVIGSESWNLVISITESAAADLGDVSTLNVKFKKDDFTTLASCTINKKAGQYYLVLTMKSGMIRYLGDRYEEVELDLGNNSGLKIPTSAVEYKTFFKIPGEFVNGSSSLFVLVKNSENAKTAHKVTPTVAYWDGEYYYVSEESTLKAGDILAMKDSADTYIVGTDEQELSGVYNINKGYATFRNIVILSQNDDYVIAQSGTNRGISLYDHIALDASKVKENMLLKQ